MARTLNPEAHAVRREVFLDAAQQLILRQGYDGTSIHEVLVETNASKGAFYHYFDSKGALLNAVVERMVDGALLSVQSTVDDPDLPALDKLHGLFAGIASWKTARKEFLLALLESWISDHNALVREKFRRLVTDRLTPVMAAILHQGKAEGVFAVDSPDDAARVFVSFLLSLNQSTTELFMARQAHLVSFDEVRRATDAQMDALERVLGAPAGSLRFFDDSLLHEWFD